MSFQQVLKPKPTNALLKAGQILMVSSILWGGYFIIFFDTTVPEPMSINLMGKAVGGGRISNLQLMHARANGVLLAIGILIVGVILYDYGCAKAAYSKST